MGKQLLRSHLDMARLRRHSSASFAPSVHSNAHGRNAYTFCLLGRMHSPQGKVVFITAAASGLVRHLASSTLERHGRIDGWVNNSGVTSFGQRESTPFEAPELAH